VKTDKNFKSEHNLQAMLHNSFGPESWREDCKAVAKFSYQAVKEKDLSFKAGDEIVVERKRSNGWWIGVCNGKRGFFPNNYVKEI